MFRSWRNAAHIRMLTGLGMWIRLHGQVNVEGVNGVRLGAQRIDLQQCRTPVWRLIRIASGTTGSVPGRSRDEHLMQTCVS
jgi:hypothetical protein